MSRIPCTEFPWSPPEEKTYGASYGGIDKNLVSRKPDYASAGLDRKEQTEIQQLMKAPFSLPTMKRPVLLLGAASGLQIGLRHKLKFPKGLSDSKRNEYELQLSKCFGPHVGSYHNKIFKRFMYATNLPLVIFLAADKIDSEIEVGKCHFILDGSLTWEKFCATHPVAFCVGCTADQMGEYSGMFTNLGFKITSGQAYTETTAFIARNNAFIEQFEHLLVEPQSPSKA